MPLQLASSTENSRLQSRTSMFLEAILRWDDNSEVVRVRNLSRNGAMVELGRAPLAGTSITLIRGSLLATGKVIWKTGNRCGLIFATDLVVRDWLAASNVNPLQRRVDEQIAEVRAGTKRSVDRHFFEIGAQSNRQLARDLNSVSSLIRDLENALSSCGETLSRHALKLQNLDLAMQMIAAVRSELNAGIGSDPEAVTSLKDLRVSCAQVLQTYRAA